MTTDGFGEWSAIATALSPGADWETIATDTFANSLFRFSFDANWQRWHSEDEISFKSYFYLKERYLGGSEKAYSNRKTKIVPHQEPILIELKSLVFPEPVQRQLLIKKYFWSPVNWLKIRPDLVLPVTITIEVLT